VARTQHYCLRNLNKIKFLYIIFFLFLFLIINFNYNYFKKVNQDILIELPQNSSLVSISRILKNNNLTNNILYPISLSMILNYDRKLSYGEFKISNNDNLYSIIKKIRFSKVHLRKLKIIEGFQKYQLKKTIDESYLHYDDNLLKNYLIVADTYYYYKGQNINSLFKKIDSISLELFNKNKGNELLKKYSINEILIISSLVEKEANNIEDKRLVSSVIFNRLDKNMKLDIDATVIYSITEGEYKLERMLNLNDLKIESIYNTYKNIGLPPEPICIPGKNTIEIVLENSTSPYYYYFYDSIINSHIFSKNYEDHKHRLNEYRKKEK